MISDKILSNISRYFPKSKNSDFSNPARNKLNIYFSIAVFLFFIIIPAFILERSSKNELGILEKKSKEISALGSEYKSIKKSVDLIEQRTSLTKTNGIASSFEDILLSLGVKEKMKSVNVSNKKELKGGMTAEVAEVQIEKVNMNELVNIFYKVENAPVISTVNNVSIKKSFEKPELLNIKMTVSMFNKK